MPVRAENKHLYPGGSPTSKEWKAISRSIMSRAQNRCERCQVRNYTVLMDGRHDGGSHVGKTYAESEALVKKLREVAKESRWGVVVLTTAHLDHDPTNNDPTNLAALCQRCHNQHDAQHRANSRRSRKAPR